MFFNKPALVGLLVLYGLFMAGTLGWWRQRGMDAEPVTASPSFPHHSPSLSLIPSPPPPSPTALPSDGDGRLYVTYTTEPHYACSALINMRRLRDMGAQGARAILVPRHRLDALPPYFRGHAHTLGVQILEVDLARPSSYPYYRDALTKLHVLRLDDFNYTRVIYFDADGLILRPMDELFDWPLPPGVVVTGVRAYWLGDRMFTSMLMIVRPNATAYHRLVQERVMNVTKLKADMDLLNAAYFGHAPMLPAWYGVLSSHWDDESHAAV